ncbi:histidine kinase [Aquamicrobium segne]|uniref:Histidine kinase n=1 Tax=Aquamicrobium segne TaxID=469547 RepID=A0ABW0H4D3_9HYPH
MPTLFRFIITLAVLAGIAYGAMVALVMFVEPKQAELSVRIPAERLDRQE